MIIPKDIYEGIFEHGLREYFTLLEKKIIIDALMSCSSKAAAARYLGIKRTTFFERLRSLNLQPDHEVTKENTWKT